MTSKYLLLLCLFSIAFSEVNGHFLFGPSPDILPAEDVSDECKQMAKEGICEYWNCFIDRWRCSGSHNFQEKSAKRYCENLRQNYAKFDDEGKRFVNESIKCLMRKFLPKYNADTNQCFALEQFGEKEHPKCNLNYGFCTAVKTNAISAMRHAYGASDTLQLFKTLSLCVKQGIIVSVWELLVKIVPGLSNFMQLPHQSR
ncbi:stanniocalcin-2 [Lingula anatina]|uniref:Stanniocalcin-2 n=1 Tax=Lingula anatina TaxID=7574 RepID=A0A1S3KBR8_LINAN|nr:stanniocalcin-2 [Lingula anatina]|eukprot:XP_013419942.1 stanniocalcin-2 [Lingula anatina]